ncbi:MAG: DVU_1553 family AMP-dependent CoA ligase [Desulfomonilaceae bacterium]
MVKTPLEKWIASKVSQKSSEENLDQTDLRSYQLEQLKRTVDYARSESPFYRQTLNGLSSECLRNLEDIGQFPFTTSDHLQGRGAEFLCVSQSEIERVVTLRSPGLDTIIRRLYFTANEVERTVDFFHHGMSTLVEAGQKVLILMPGERPDTVGDLLVRSLARMGVEGIVYGFVQDAAHALREIDRLNIDVLVGIPTQALSLARHDDCAFVRPGRIKSVFLSSDYVSPAIVMELQRAWGCRVFNHYGSTEMGFGGGVECQALHGYHMREADLYFEIVDPQTGKILQYGQPGEIVFTTLTRRAMPLIRYRTGDLSRFLSEPCPCGSTLRRLDRVRGRISDFVRLGTNHWLGTPDLDDTLFAIPGLLDYRAIINDCNHHDKLDMVIDVGSQQSEGVLNKVRNALMETQVLRDAIDDGSLSLGSVIFGSLNPSETSAFKRSVNDHRGEAKKR